MDEQSPFKGQTGLRRLWKALGYSRAGLKAAYEAEDAFRQEVLLAVLLIPLAFVLAEGGMERALLIGSVLLVLIVELINSAIEAVVDRVSLEVPANTHNLRYLAAKRDKMGHILEQAMPGLEP